jgi:hypothetical protein
MWTLTLGALQQMATPTALPQQLMLILLSLFLLLMTTLAALLPQLQLPLVCR